MNPASRICQNCKKGFQVESEDFDFYNKIGVPAPTWCPQCRLMRRLAFRNERTLYRTVCGLCKKDILTIYAPEALFPVYCKECWYGDGWDAAEYAQAYDFSRPFFDQLKDLFMRVPRLALYQVKVENSPYGTSVVESKNVYLGYSIVRSEDIMFSKSIDTSRYVLDSFECVSLEQCYANVNCEKNYASHFMALSQNCMNSWFLYDCANCRNCVMSSNLRNREYVIRNVQYTKEEYAQKISDMRLESATVLESLQEEFRLLQQRALRKYADIKKSVGTTGNHITNAKNAVNCFQVYDVENVKHCYRILSKKDTYDMCYSGWGELCYEHVTGGTYSSEMRFSLSNPENLRATDYVAFSMSAHDLFGCVGLRKGEYAILNKSYSPEEYKALRAKIIAHMDEMPYVDPQGRIWKYGEFFPLEFAAPFGYNETTAYELFPIAKEEALAQGFTWREPEAKSHAITMEPAQLPDTIVETQDSILKEVIGCIHAGTCGHQCTTAFRLVPDELQFYRRHNLPLPRACPNCRHFERAKNAEPLTLWRRQCMCVGEMSKGEGWKNTATHFHGAGACPIQFETPYAPERPEAVYCEQCYQAEVV